LQRTISACRAAESMTSFEFSNCYQNKTNSRKTPPRFNRYSLLWSTTKTWGHFRNCWFRLSVVKS